MIGVCPIGSVGFVYGFSSLNCLNDGLPLITWVKFCWDDVKVAFRYSYLR
ncbi:hypothetical protein EVA_19304 [gut metagenome]|uniref:Uncharacterized protein n=1 Tax=gut metagenome TaxID=749906 RepID=J9FZ44_9ZZZZ